MAHNGDISQVRSASGWALLRTKDFGLLFFGQTMSQIGDSMNKVALLWFVYELSGSAFAMTIIGLLQTIPPLLFGPLIGVYLDRMRKKPVMIWVDLLRAILVALIPLLYALEALTLERLYILVFVISLVSMIFGPALASAVPLLVSRVQLTAANALIQGTGNIGFLIGPAVSGLGIAIIGAQNVFYLDAFTFAVSALCIVPISLRETPKAIAHLAGRGGIFQELLVGFRFVFCQHRIIFLLMLTATFYSFGTSAFVFILPVFAREVLDVSPIELGWLWSALGIGMLAASALLAKMNRGDIRSWLKLISAALALGAVAVCALGVSHAPALAAVLIVVFGGSTAVFTPVMWAMLQELTPESLLGRVFTTFSTGAMASAMAGMAGFGWATDAVGPGASLLGIGLVLLGTAIVAVACSRRHIHQSGTETFGLMAA